jgi:flagellar basal body-associated protein FliL
MTRHKHKILFIAAYVAMPALLAWVGYEFSGYDFAKKSVVHNSGIYKDAGGSSMTYYDLPRVSLSMGTNTGGNGTMKLDLSLEVQKIDLQRVVDFEPRIIEKILIFMRKQNYEKFQQPNGARELRKSLEQEIRKGAFPIRIAAVDVREMVFE